MARAQANAQLTGILPVYKPAGMISKDVSRWLVRHIGKCTIGHAGTLDPLAEGVLPILLGKATKQQDRILEMPKAYEFWVELGRQTDTLDADGKDVGTAPWEHVTLEDMRAKAEQFVGTITQVPPLYSAVKVNGVPLYDYARRGEGATIDRQALARQVTVHAFSVLGLEGKIARLRVDCSKGTYVRILAEDLCASLGTCGTVVRMIRIHAGGIQHDAAHSLDTIAAVWTATGSLASLLLPAG